MPSDADPLDSHVDDAGPRMIAEALVSGSDRARRQARLVGRILIAAFGLSILVSVSVSVIVALF